MAVLKSKGGRVVTLKVSVASHCPLMQSASQALQDYLAGVDFLTPGCDVVFNASARPEHDPVRIRKLLTDQIISTVRWVESIEYALAQGHRPFHRNRSQIGPGRPGETDHPKGTDRSEDLRMKIDLSGQVAVVTGASRGIGAAVARCSPQAVRMWS